MKLETCVVIVLRALIVCVLLSSFVQFIFVGHQLWWGSWVWRFVIFVWNAWPNTESGNTNADCVSPETTFNWYVFCYIMISICVSCPGQELTGLLTRTVKWIFWFSIYFCDTGMVQVMFVCQQWGKYCRLLLSYVLVAITKKRACRQ